MATLFMSPLGDDKYSWEKELSGVHRMCSHSLVSTYVGYTYVPMFCLYRKVYLHSFFQIPLPPIFQSCSCQPLTLQQIHWSQTINVYIHPTSGCFSFQAKWATRCITLRSIHWENFPSPVSFQDVSERGSSATAVHFGVAPTYHAEPSLIRPKAFLLSADHRELPWGLLCKPGGRR